MATTNPYIGRRESIGFGIETTPGTSVTPASWMRWLDQDIQDKADIIENDSALGVVEKINDSEVVAKYAEGTIGGKITDEGIGYLLLGLFGTVSTGAPVSTIYPHTFTVNQSSIPKALTIARANPLQGVRYSYATVDSLEISAEAGGWVQVSAAVKARASATASDTPAFTTEAEFTSKHITTKIAANIAGLGAATILKAKSVKLNLERTSEAFNPLGTDSTPEFDRGAFEAKGELVLRYTDTQYETDYLANTLHAMEIKMTNGTKVLTFTAGRVRYRELDRSTDKDEVVTQTVSFACELDPSTSKTIEALLNNSKTAYA